MAGTKFKPPTDDRSFTSWKLDILNAACADPRMTAGQFRFFARVLAAINQDTGIAILSDETAADEVPGCKSRHTCNDHRKAIADLGWWSYDHGSGRTGTRYAVSDANVNGILDDLTVARHVRKERRAVVKSPRADQSSRGHTTPDTVVVPPPVHLQSTPSLLSLPAQDKTQDTHTPVPTHEPCIVCGRPSMGLNGAGKPACVRHLSRAIRERIHYQQSSRGE